MSCDLVIAVYRFDLCCRKYVGSSGSRYVCSMLLRHYRSFSTETEGGAPDSKMDSGSNSSIKDLEVGAMHRPAVVVTIHLAAQALAGREVAMRLLGDSPWVALAELHETQAEVALAYRLVALRGKQPRRL